MDFLPARNYLDKTRGILFAPEVKVKVSVDCFARTLSCLSYRSCAVLPNLFSRSNIYQFIIMFYVYIIIIYVFMYIMIIYDYSLLVVCRKTNLQLDYLSEQDLSETLQ